MTTPQLTDLVKMLVQDYLNPESVDLDKNFREHGGDSLDDVELVMAFEEHLGLTIDDVDAERLAGLPLKETIIWLESQLAQKS